MHLSKLLAVCAGAFLVSAVSPQPAQASAVLAKGVLSRVIGIYPASDSVEQHRVQLSRFGTPTDVTVCQVSSGIWYVNNSDIKIMRALAAAFMAKKEVYLHVKESESSGFRCVVDYVFIYKADG